MKSIIQYILWGMVILLAMIGLYQVVDYFKDKRENTTVHAHIIRDRVEKVLKMVTVEANYSEIFDYKSFLYSDIWPLRKKALVKVQATVMAGYDIESFQVTIDSLQKKIFIRDPTAPIIISIETDLDFYSFENGWFNMINNKDITEMSADAKEKIRTLAENSDLLDKAAEQKKDLIDLLELSLRALGWTLVIESEPLIKG